jgi:hypothetical protein
MLRRDKWRIAIRHLRFQNRDVIFEDSAYYSSIWNKKVEESPFNQPRNLTTRDGQVVLRYLRVVEAGCDLYHKEKAACWEQLKKRLELKRTQAPVCSGYTPDSWESVIAYPVEVDLTSRQRTEQGACAGRRSIIGGASS